MPLPNGIHLARAPSVTAIGAVIMRPCPSASENACGMQICLGLDGSRRKIAPGDCLLQGVSGDGQKRGYRRHAGLHAGLAEDALVQVLGHALVIGQRAVAQLEREFGRRGRL